MICSSCLTLRDAVEAMASLRWLMGECCSDRVYALKYFDVAGEFRWGMAEKLSPVAISDQMNNDVASERLGKVTTDMRGVINHSAIVGLLIFTSVRTVRTASSTRRHLPEPFTETANT